MNPVSPHFTTVDLSKSFNARRAELPESLRIPAPLADRTGAADFNGIPFQLGEAEGPAVILLDAEPVLVDLGGAHARARRLSARGCRPHHQLP